MKLDLNDPKWTAYAFDELEGDERAAIEAELRANPAAQLFVDELRRTGELLRSALAAEPAGQLTAEQHATLAAVAVSNQPSAVSLGNVAASSPGPRHGKRLVAVIGAIAASVVIVSLFLPAVRMSRESGKRTVAKIENEAERISSVQTVQPNASDPSGSYLQDDVKNFPPSNRVNLSGTAESVSDAPSTVNTSSRDRWLTSSSGPIGAADPKPSYGNKGGGVGYGGHRPALPAGDSSNPAAPLGGAGYGLPSVKNRQDTHIISSRSVVPDLKRSSVFEHRSDELELSEKSTTLGTIHGNDAGATVENTPAGGLVGPDKIEFLEGVDQSVIRGNPQDAERVRAIVREIDQLTEPSSREASDKYGRPPLQGKEAEVARLTKELRELTGGPRIQLNEIDETFPGSEAYEAPPENAFEPVAANPLSTFSIDVDTASYANIRRFLTQNNQLPPPAAVRIEEMINYFRYDYPQPKEDVPFSVTTEVATCPWNTDHRLVRVGLKGKEIAREKRPVSNLVFLLDVSGSMQPANKLPLVREVTKLLVRELSENDRVAIVVYAGASGMVLESTTADQKDTIIAAIDNLQSGGSTNGAGGIQQAYDVATANFITGGTNRVILATDGDFNVGITDRGDLVKLIEEKAKSGVFLTTLGFGYGNLKDATLEQLADKGNGNYGYVDTLAEGRKLLVEELSGTLVTIAKDVKVQIEFNPAEVASYRLIGYENRRLAAEDFNDDKKDAGEIGAGHTVTALYELAPARKVGGGANPGLPAGAADSTAAKQPGVDSLRYQKPAEAKVELTDAANTGELFTLKLRYKQPDGDTSKLIEHPVKDSGKAYREASGDFKFAASVAAFGMTLRRSQHRGTITLDGIKELAQDGRSFDPSGYRSEFLTLIERAAALGAK
jgi:Ca-activated chloride channel family protein